MGLAIAGSRVTSHTFSGQPLSRKTTRRLRPFRLLRELRRGLMIAGLLRPYGARAAGMAPIASSGPVQRFRS